MAQNEPRRVGTILAAVLGAGIGGVTGLLVGADWAGNHAPDAVFAGFRGYEAGGLVGVLVGLGLGGLLGLLVSRRSARGPVATL
jgi:hypothetical protein